MHPNGQRQRQRHQQQAANRQTLGQIEHGAFSSVLFWLIGLE
jgi:hypothetical protein